MIIEQNDQVATLSLNSPDRHNALDEEMFESLESTLDGLDDDHSGPVLRIRGEGPSFCSGFDLDVCTRDREMLGRFLTGLSRVSRRLRRDCRNIRHTAKTDRRTSALCCPRSRHQRTWASAVGVR